MPYKFALHPSDYSDLSAGRVLYSQPGLTAFPVRLASEIFQRCQAFRARMGFTGQVALYDPCCGGAYLLTILGLLHGSEISAVSASDIDAQALDLAARNLSLLSPAGLERRKDEINHYIQAYGKASHQAALASAVRLGNTLDQALAGRQLPTHLFQADATHPQAMGQGLAGQSIDLVITDIPYGWKSAWSFDEKHSQTDQSPPDTSNVARLLDALHTLLPARCLVAIASDKQQKVTHSDYRRLDRFQVGKRQVTILLRAGR
jgi:23S rRNA (guanine2535-N1)-methyltransferase